MKENFKQVQYFLIGFFLIIIGWVVIFDNCYYVLAQEVAYTRPIMFGYSDYTGLSAEANISPFIIWGNALQDGSHYSQEVANLAKLDPSLKKMVAFASYEVMETKLSQIHAGFANEAEYLHSIGVKYLGYNTETERDGPGTPVYQLQHALDLNDNNSVAQFARIAEQYGFDSVWIPYRGPYQQTILEWNPSSSEPRPNTEHFYNPNGNWEKALAYMVQAGLDAVWFQEQQHLSQSCANTRTDAFYYTKNKYEEIIDKYRSELGIPAGKQLTYMVQMRASSCDEADTFNFSNSCGLGNQEYCFQACDAFIDGVGNNLYGMGIWTMNDNTASVHELIRVLRAGSGSFPSPTPSPTDNPACKADLDGSGTIDKEDLLTLLPSWLKSLFDINEDNKVNSLDFAWIVKYWGQNCY